MRHSIDGYRPVVMTLCMLVPLLADGGETKPHPEVEQATAESEKTAAGKPSKTAASTAPEDGERSARAPKSNRKTAVTWQAVLKVANPTAVREQIEASARTSGGFLTYFDDKRIVVKIPHAALSSLTAQIAKQGFLLQKTINREDLTLRIAELLGRLKSKKEILARTRSFLSSSDLASTLDIERSMAELVTETEAIQGALRVLSDRAAFAVVVVDFEFKERDKVLYIDSPFEWLNTVDLSRFVQEF